VTRNIGCKQPNSVPLHHVAIAVGVQGTNGVPLHYIAIAIDVQATKPQYKNCSSDAIGLPYEMHNVAFRVAHLHHATASQAPRSPKRAAGYQKRP
jgi:hypothetical protein